MWIKAKILMQKITVLFIVTLVISFFNVALAKKKHSLALSTIWIATYQCDNKVKIKATYYELSDYSLQFVKLNIIKRDYTLTSDATIGGMLYNDKLHSVEWLIVADKQTKKRYGSFHDDFDHLEFLECNEVEFLNLRNKK